MSDRLPVCSCPGLSVKIYDFVFRRTFVQTQTSVSGPPLPAVRRPLFRQNTPFSTDVHGFSGPGFSRFSADNDVKMLILGYGVITRRDMLARIMETGQQAGRQRHGFFNEEAGGAKVFFDRLRT